MTNVEKVKIAFEKELKKAEIEDIVLTILPEKPSSICVFEKEIYVTYRLGTFPEKFSFQEAINFYRKFEPFIQICEHWNDGCIEVKPNELSDYKNKEKATKVNESFAEILLYSYGSRGEYIDSSLIFYAKIENYWFKVSMEFQNNWCWFPQRQVSYDRDGNISNFTLSIKGFGEDFQRKWYSEKPGYRISYYWKTKELFEKWIEKQS
jgi:hypothetical protein